MSARGEERGRDRRAALSVFLVLAALYLLTASGLPDNPDAEVEFQTASALAHGGTFVFGDTPEARAILEQRFDVAPGRDGRLYSWFGVGQAFTGVPCVLLGAALAELLPALEARHAATTAFGSARSAYFEHLLAGLRNPLWMALCGALVFACARHLGVGRRLAWLAALWFGIATFAWAQARSTLSDVQATACLMLAAHAVLRLRADSERDGAPHASSALQCGLALGVAVLTRVALAPAACAVLGAAVLVLVRARASVRTHVSLTAPLALSAAIFAETNLARFGSEMETGYGHALREGTFFSYPLHLGLAGLLFAPGKGLIWMASGLVLAAWGVRAAWGRGERLWIGLCAVVAVATILPVACAQTWHGAYTYGPRYLLPLVPLAWPLVALALERGTPRALVRSLAFALAALGLATSLPSVAVDAMTHQDLAAQAARIAYPEPGGADERERDEARFLLIQWDWRFAAPWAHWRILRHRLVSADEQFPVAEIFFLDADGVLSPRGERERGWRHFAWVDLEQRLGGTAWPVLLALAAVLAAAVYLARETWQGEARASDGVPR